MVMVLHRSKKLILSIYCPISLSLPFSGPSRARVLRKLHPTFLHLSWLLAAAAEKRPHERHAPRTRRTRPRSAQQVVRVVRAGHEQQRAHVLGDLEVAAAPEEHEQQLLLPVAPLAATRAARAAAAQRARAAAAWRRARARARPTVARAREPVPEQVLLGPHHGVGARCSDLDLGPRSPSAVEVQELAAGLAQPRRRARQPAAGHRVRVRARGRAPCPRCRASLLVAVVARGCRAAARRHFGVFLGPTVGAATRC